MNVFAWAAYMFAPPRPRVLTWPLDHLAARAGPVAPIDGPASTTTCALPLAGAPRRFTVMTAHGAEEWDL